MTPRLSRRNALKAVLGGLTVASAGLLTQRKVRAEDPSEDPRFLIVLTATGGASIIDSVMAVRASECPNASRLNTFPDEQVQSIPGSPFRAVKYASKKVGPLPYAVDTDQAPFVKKYHQDLLAVTWTTTSVNHAVGERRAITGNEAWRGRTLQEIVAAYYGKKALLPNAHLVAGLGFNEAGSDTTLPDYAFGEVVAEPLYWPLSLHGTKGTPARDKASQVADARALRSRLEAASEMNRVYQHAPLLKRWRELRDSRLPAFEQANLIDRLLFLPNDDKHPLGAYGLSPSADAQRVRDAFPDYDRDPVDAQAALAFLLLKQRLSVAITLGFTFELSYNEAAGGLGNGELPPGALFNLPIGFDFSHQSHRAAQALMWSRVFKVVDGLITLLKSEEYAGGQSLWDRTLLYIATDFGRTKDRPENHEGFGSGHDLNNGVLLLSPMVNGNRILGGVDPTTCLTYGFDPITGAPDPGRTMNEAQIFSGILGALRVDTSASGLPDVPAMRKG
ncbi:MAG: hypothetical protein RMJ98_15455 [Myxococcales bacterium]|nr:hypothetical protein [Polyangiaceae bacterium]MDW8250691.1 hypothetical protein [Myxococcales bacterium]